MRQGVRVVFPAELAELLGLYSQAVSDEEFGATDLVVALGGDGTLLAANRAASPYGTPVLGVHVGGPASFGFLTETTPAEAGRVVEAVLQGRYRVEERVMISAEIHRAGVPAGNYHGLNEIVVRGQSRMLKMRVSVGETYIATYAADGIIVATPTGSTAYNLAAGGPLVHPAVDALLLTPICPHTLNVRSLLTGVDHVIHVGLSTGDRETALLTVDGQTSISLQDQDKLTFRKSELRGRFVAVDGANFYHKVQTRLRLGERFGN